MAYRLLNIRKNEMNLKYFHRSYRECDKKMKQLFKSYMPRFIILLINQLKINKYYSNQLGILTLGDVNKMCCSPQDKNASKNKPKKDDYDDPIFDELKERLKKIAKDSKSSEKRTNSNNDTSKSKDEDEKDKFEFSKTYTLRYDTWLSIFMFFFIVSFMFTILSENINFHKIITWQYFKHDILRNDNLLQINICNDNLLNITTKNQNQICDLTILSIDIFRQSLLEACKEFNINPDTIKYTSFKKEKSDKYTPTLSTITFMLFSLYCMYLMYRGYNTFNKFLTSSRVKGKGGDNPLTDIFPFMGKQFKAFKPSQSSVKFSDVKGCEESKKEIMEFVEFLKSPDKFHKMGAKIPTGAILYGPPGTGKTMLAKAVAGEANVPFFFAAGSEFIEMIVGVGAKRIRELFQLAKESSPCIIFIDEIDAIGSKRSQHRSSSENDQTLNQLLCELDGFNTDTNIVVLCGTNQFKQLDSALIRPGRLDRKIYLAPPDIKGRGEIFDSYLSKIKIDQMNRKTYSERLASLTPGSTGADIANICNEGAILATKDDTSFVKLNHLEQALDRLVMGNRLSQKLSVKEKRIVSIHECGHAVVAWYLRNTFPLLKISIVPRGNALGMNQFLPLEDHLYSKEQLLDMMSALLGGRAAEELIVGTISSGASDDLQRVTQMAYRQVGVFGMDESFGLISLPSINDKFSNNNRRYGGETAEYGPELANKIDVCVRILIEEAYTKSQTIVLEKKELLLKLSQLLYDKEVLSTEEIEKVLGPRPDGAITVKEAMTRHIDPL